MIELLEAMMLLSLKDGAGRTLDAVILTASANHMRLAVRDFADAMELNYAYGEWKTEDGLAIEIESILTDGSLPQGFFDHFASRVRTAG